MGAQGVACNRDTWANGVVPDSSGLSVLPWTCMYIEYILAPKDVDDVAKACLQHVYHLNVLYL